MILRYTGLPDFIAHSRFLEKNLFIRIQRVSNCTPTRLIQQMTVLICQELRSKRRIGSVISGSKSQGSVQKVSKSIRIVLYFPVISYCLPVVGNKISSTYKRTCFPAV